MCFFVYHTDPKDLPNELTVESKICQIVASADESTMDLGWRWDTLQLWVRHIKKRERRWLIAQTFPSPLAPKSTNCLALFQNNLPNVRTKDIEIHKQFLWTLVKELSGSPGLLLLCRLKISKNLRRTFCLKGSSTCSDSITQATTKVIEHHNLAHPNLSIFNHLLDHGLWI